MNDIELTGTLKTYKAIVVYADEVPEGYIILAGAYVKGKEVTIAVPDNLQTNYKLLNRLGHQAEWCIMKAIPEESFGDED